MAITRFIFPVLAILIPVGVVGGVFWNSSRKAVREYNEQVEKAKALGFILSREEYEKSVPPDGDNAVPWLCKASDAIDWTKTPPIYRVPMTLKDTDPADNDLLEALSKKAAALSFANTNKVWEDLVKIDRANILIAQRVGTYAFNHDLTKAKEWFDGAVRLRDLYFKSNFAPLAAKGQQLNAMLEKSALTCAARNGPAGVAIARTVLLPGSDRLDRAKSWQAVPAFQLALLDDLRKAELEDPSPALADFRQESSVLQAKSEILAWACLQTNPKSLEAKQTVDGNITPEMTLHGARWESATPGIINIAFQPMMGITTSTTSVIRGDLRPWFLRACEAGGKEPEGLKTAKDWTGSPIRLKPLTGGFTIYSFGKDKKDSGGKGDDPFIRFQISRVDGKL